MRESNSQSWLAKPMLSHLTNPPNLGLNEWLYFNLPLILDHNIRALPTKLVPLKLAERGGFEPPIGFAYTAFPVLRLKPLGHLSV